MPAAIGHGVAGRLGVADRVEPFGLLGDVGWGEALGSLR